MPSGASLGGSGGTLTGEVCCGLRVWEAITTPVTLIPANPDFSSWRRLQGFFAPLQKGWAWHSQQLAQSLLQIIPIYQYISQETYGQSLSIVNKLIYEPTYTPVNPNLDASKEGIARLQR